MQWNYESTYGSVRTGEWNQKSNKKSCAIQRHTNSVLHCANWVWLKNLLDGLATPKFFWTNDQN